MHFMRFRAGGSFRGSPGRSSSDLPSIDVSPHQSRCASGDVPDDEEVAVSQIVRAHGDANVPEGAELIFT